MNGRSPHRGQDRVGLSAMARRPRQHQRIEIACAATFFGSTARRASYLRRYRDQSRATPVSRA